MNETELKTPEEACTHDCSTCGSACGDHGCGSSEGGEMKPSFFDRVDTLVEELHKDEVQEMLAKLTEELERS